MGLKLSITCLHMFRISVVCHVHVVSQSLVLLQYTALVLLQANRHTSGLHTYTPHIRCFELADEGIRINNACTINMNISSNENVEYELCYAGRLLSLRHACPKASTYLSHKGSNRKRLSLYLGNSPKIISFRSLVL